MITDSKLRSPYEVRIDLVQETIKAHSPLDDDAARELAVQVLLVLNSIPEKIR
ncbi:MAG: hypothetical protein QOG19_815 [Mycobacterium sp.]|jgi:hypothetical protein|nr:hypothetical protein [Mycobacterium sp.]MDT5175435.1 hypothetical protein [Mycobacterium sp.]MDT5223408.1 hypothetical protein [Mycobacterium sp.]